ncbi:carbonic anhydrase [Candidatus Methylospira mobilis]|uniref:Carbonic anhydrase n=1 Tax=Candidatus Methylospira mobilis TaxID=1808979 RepID=A0A5Q0BIC7_9GAMM|nr:carbonic anhydrase [Candidatus Methylospira mobilis]QFY41951.1 carbonic anhydrase [Candidatus Methylospira mobilis]WNV02941.1 carbonic anhydrase [Candidatus Methylospira mobilis]
MNQKNSRTPYVKYLDVKNCGRDEQVIAPSSQSLAATPTVSRHNAILTCKCIGNGRVNPAKLIGISDRETHIVYSNGGQATRDAILALIDSSKLLGTREWYIIHHTNCDENLSLDEFSYSSNDNRRDRRQDSRNLRTPKNHIQRLAEHARRIRHHPLVPRDIPVHGCWYNGKTGNVLRVSTDLRQPLNLTLE